MKAFPSLLLVGFLILPTFGVIDLTIIALMAFTASKTIFTLLQERRSDLRVRDDAAIFLLAVSMLWVITIILYFVSGARDLDAEFMFKPPRVIIIMCLLIVAANYSSIPMRDYYRVVVIAAFVNAIVIYLQYVLHFLGITDSFLQNPDFGDNALTPYRKAGLMSGFPVSGMLSFIGALCSMYLYDRSGCRAPRYLISYFIIGLTCFITARTALYIFFAFGIPYFYYILVKNGKIGYISFSILVVAALFVFMINSENRIIQGSIDKMFANVQNYFETGSALDYSTRDLFGNHYVFPTRETTLMFGTSLPNQMNVVNSDVSIFRITWYSGVFTALLYVMLFFGVWLSMICRSSSRSEKYLLIFLCAGLTLANMKGSYIFSRVLGDAMLVLWVGKLYGKDAFMQKIGRGSEATNIHPL